MNKRVYSINDRSHLEKLEEDLEMVQDKREGNVYCRGKSSTRTSRDESILDTTNPSTLVSVLRINIHSRYLSTKYKKVWENHVLSQHIFKLFCIQYRSVVEQI